MPEKKPSAIQKITLNRATFDSETIDRLTYVNFFYGNNGTGKTTIARCIEDGEGLEWADGRSPEDFKIAVYSQKFIADQFSDYGGLNGVFTVDKTNIDIRDDVEEKEAQLRNINDEIPVQRKALIEKEKVPNHLLTAFQDECYKKAAKIRDDFDAALDKRKQKKNFADALLAETNPMDHDLNELKRIYDTAFDSTTREYPMFSTAPGFIDLPGYDLFEKPIVSRSDTPFAQFIKALNATDWVRTGHDHYLGAADGKCPFCQRPLDESFEAEIATCFDEQYQQELNDLKNYRDTYTEETKQIVASLDANLSDILPGVDISDYRSKLALLKKNIEINLQRLSEKISEPTKVILLEDINRQISEINALIAKINQKISENNIVVEERQSSKNKCRDNLMQYLAFLLGNEIKNYRTEKAAAEKAIQDIKNKINQLQEESRRLSAEIALLNSQRINTSDAMNAINNRLIESGFLGFRLRAKDNVENTYEVIRENGEIASNLSEGERNFIAFLYFHQMVCGSLDQNGLKDTIVVIDDPVSSMDSTALFFVSGIIRTMISICRNNADYRDQKASGDFIKQIFILTHNVYFHKEVTYQQLGYYDCTSFYMIRKSRNVSTVKLCERQSAVPTEMENYNPVQNSYAALWDELRDVQSTNAAKNIMRRILEYYFLQLCGYEGEDLRDRILESEESRNKFIVPVEDGSPDISNYEMAMSLLSYIDAAHVVGDDISLTEDSDNVEAYKNVFELIFDALGQSQHYNMMMGKQRES